MAVPTSFNDLNTTPASNSPQGSEAVFPDLDNHLRVIYAFLASIKANGGNGWASTYLTAANPTYTGNLSGGTGGTVNLANRITVNSAGNVTISPAASFTVSGSVVTASGSSNWGTVGSNAVAGSFWQFYKGGTTTQIAYIGSDGGGAVSGGLGNNFAIRAEGALILAAGAATAATISTTGNVVINAPSAGYALNLPTQTPASAAAAGTAGDICWDASYIYVCTATNTWKRAAIASW